jgi:hypothetical protein
MVLPRGWSELSRIFRLHYASELSFVHLPTLVGPLATAFDRSPNDQLLGQTLSSAQRLSLDSSGLTLAFLALTLRHCRGSISQYIIPGAQDANNGAALSAHFAILATHSLVAYDAGESQSHIEGLQVRLMLASYNWSMGKSQRARQLLLEASLMAHEPEYHQGLHTRRRSSNVSVAMAFEAESMGLQSEAPVSNDELSFDDMCQEVRKRVRWSCFLMDTQYSFGEHRSRLIRETTDKLPLPGCEVAFMSTVQGNTPSDRARKVSYSSSRSDPRSVASPPTYEILTPAPSRSLSPGSDSLDRSDDNIHHHYLRSLSVLHRIHKWTCSDSWRCVYHQVFLDHR